MTVATLPRLGFAGLGWIGRHRMNALRDSGAVDIALLCDPVADLSADDCQSTQSFDELLASDVDAIVIATPNSFHATQAIAALERGKAVFCQKPLGRNAAETQRVIDAARVNDRFLAVDLSYRYTAAMRAVRDAINSGELGDVFAAELTFHNAYGPDKAWFYDRTLSGGGCLIDLGVHLVDLLLWTFSDARVVNVTSRLFAKGDPHFDREHTVEDYVTARLDLGSGATANIACSWNLNAGRDCVIDIRFFGTRGAVGFHNVNGSFHDFVAERYDGTRTTRLTEPPDAWGGRAAVTWAERLRDDPSFDPAIESVASVARALDAIYDAGARP
ncbi:MAG TPA: Gfo/Idh/MocA family oxidoreductase [Thermoanaerobaculia bacterium]|nr:Gfo/Idh/MocA family oxidoreductase [Thermoanaerobaculia bacterium]